ncbi:GPI mannosyltransferase 4 [Choanephora cucurbitarum]|uniref:Mannosyltransferase n=1 Tax=Choanephora cucurbitarum TaxID=101091 RepID=A0A1C7NPX7_9FUNG|nr:GPI mannosyltransferase 4 [Choanephora cucurbitarum]
MKGVIVTFVCLGLLLRWFTAILPGYIHPDEFFQNPEITSGMIFKIETLIPWEYQPEHASRSIVSPLLTTGLPFFILKQFLPNDQLPSGTTLFYTERLSSLLWSLLVDMSVYKLCRHMGTDPLVPMVLVATSLVTFVFGTRPFSNSFESILLCQSLVVYADYLKEASYKRAYFLGCLFALGVFTRITFPLYALPIGIVFLYQTYKNNKNVGAWIVSIVPMFLGLFTTSAVCIALDSLYYGTLWLTVNDQPMKDVLNALSILANPALLATVQVHGHVVLTPFNNLSYNLDVSNLAQHGLHARYTHVLVNLPLLYGPLAIFCLMYIPKAYQKIRQGATQGAHLFCVLLAIFASGLIGLSIMPHQEARFLCPLLVPLVLMYNWDQPVLPIPFFIAWLLFNLITTCIFGLVHQGGVVPALNFVQRFSSGIQECHLAGADELACTLLPNHESIPTDFELTTHVVFYKTYMPPRHLLTIPLDNTTHQIRVTDLSSDFDALVEVLERRPGVPLRRHSKNKVEIDFVRSREGFERTLLVTPGFVDLPKIENHRYLLVHKLGPHVSFDDFDKLTEVMSESDSPEGQMSLDVYLMLSEKDNLA